MGIINYIVTVKNLKPATKKFIKFLPLRDDTGHNPARHLPVHRILVPSVLICDRLSVTIQEEHGGYSF